MTSEYNEFGDQEQQGIIESTSIERSPKAENLDDSNIIANDESNTLTTEDAVNPSHYASGSLQLIELVRHMGFSLGNSVKYIFRHQNKNAVVQDLEKSLWYLQDFVSFPNAQPLPPHTDKLVHKLLSESSSFEIEVIKKLVELNKIASADSSSPQFVSIASEVAGRINAEILLLKEN